MPSDKKALNHLIEAAKLWIEQENEGLLEIIPVDYEQPASKPASILSSLVQKKVENKQLNVEVKLPPIDQWIDVAELAEVEVFLMTNAQDPKIKLLVERLTQAIDSRIAKAKLIQAKPFEENQLWPTLFSKAKKLRHVLVSEMEFYQWPHLLKHYQKTPKRQVFEASLFLLADLNCYNQDPELKKSLWNSLLNEL